MRTVRINTPSPYDVLIGTGARAELKNAAGSRAFIVTDGNVAENHLNEFLALMDRAGSFTMPAGESHKGHNTLLALYEAMAERGVTRSDTLVALGGGVVCDLAGFAAATYMRGIRYIACPTTLIAMADAAIGGKCGVNLSGGKNLVGIVRQPSMVIADTDMLGTLPKREYASGMAEIIKCGAIGDAELFDLTGTDADIGELVYRACLVKKDYVEIDEFDQNERHILNFGHTAGHAIERASGLTLLHGEAVATGMMAEARLGERLGVTRPEAVKRIESALLKAGLPTEYNGDKSALRESLLLDKKRCGSDIYTALITDIGAAVYMSVPAGEFLKAI